MKSCPALIACVLLGVGAAPDASAQTMEPLSYSNAPIGLNFLILGYTH